MTITDHADTNLKSRRNVRSMLESLPPLFPLAPHLNAHARADRNSLAIRRLWTDLLTARWLPSY